MRKIFVVGGGGFIGGHLVERLRHTAGVEQITVFDNLSSGSFEHIPPCLGITCIEGNARDYDFLRKNMAGHDTVFHLAANPDIAKAATEPTIDFEQGTVLTQNVLEAMRENGVKRLIYTSGSGVYGEPAGRALNEDSGPMNPISTYGASKLASEALISAYCHMFGLTARCFRFANVVGPRQTHGVGYDFLRKLKADRTKLAILGDGTQTKSYVAVSDVISAMLLVLDRVLLNPDFDSPEAYNVYNCGTNDTLTVTQIAEMAVLASGIPPGYVRFDYGTTDRGWKGDVPRIKMDYWRIHSLGWRPQLTSKDAMWVSLIAMAEELK